MNSDVEDVSIDQMCHLGGNFQYSRRYSYLQVQKHRITFLV